jgi:hypothetical protein
VFVYWWYRAVYVSVLSMVKPYTLVCNIFVFCQFGRWRARGRHVLCVCLREYVEFMYELLIVTSYSLVSGDAI